MPMRHGTEYGKQPRRCEMSENEHEMDWRKSSYSNGTGECVEVATWRKSSHSNSSGACVEVGGAATVVLVRDTTNRDGATLTIPVPAWRTLLAEVRAS
jgi:hypothetical protein